MKKIMFLWLLLIGLMTVQVQAAELIINGDFSAPVTPGAGIPGWVTYTSEAGYQPVTATTTYDYSTNNDGEINAYRSNSPGAFVGVNIPFASGQSNVLSQLKQSILMPAALGATLTCYYQWRANNLGSHEYMRIMFGNTLAIKTGADANIRSWIAGEIKYYLPINSTTGVIEANGQKLDLIFQTKDDATYDANYMLVDDVSLITGPIATATATPTITKTNTPSPTPTFTSTITPTWTVTPTISITPSVTKTITLTPWFVQPGNIAAYPNPANGNQVRFIYTTQQAITSTTIVIYNLAGLKVSTLTDGPKPAGINQLTTWDISNVAPGVYLYRLTVEADGGYKHQTKFKKLVITK